MVVDETDDRSVQAGRQERQEITVDKPVVAGVDARHRDTQA